MGIGYQMVDRHVFDYNMYFIEDGRIGLRGPKNYFGQGDYLVFSGAAQTFGRFVLHPFPELVGRFSRKQTLNLGFSGAGPEFYLKRPALIKLIANSELHFLQAMSARSVSAGIFECQGNNGVLRFLDGPRKDQTFLAAEAYQLLLKEYGNQAYQEQVEQAQSRWVELNRELITSTTVPTYLVWVSSKPIGENISATSAVGEFPHFVTQDMIDEIRKICVDIVDCSFEDTRPQPLISDINGMMVDVFDRKQFPKRVEHIRAFNVYYATPKHHELIASTLLQALLNR